MQATVNWQQDMRFSCETDTGHKIEMDGNGERLTPMESVLLSVGACSSIDVVEIMKKSRQAIESCRCELSATRSEKAPRVFESIHAKYIVSGLNISEKHLSRAVTLSAEKYCSVMLMLHHTIDISTSYEIE